MAETHDYQVMNDAAPAIEGMLAAHVADGWRPILMSATTNYEATSTCNVLYGLRKRWIQPHSHKSALREKYQWGTLRRYQLKRD